MISDLVWIVLNVLCLIAFAFFIKAENKNTKVRKEQIKAIEKGNKTLEEILRRIQ